MKLLLLLLRVRLRLRPLLLLLLLLLLLAKIGRRPATRPLRSSSRALHDTLRSIHGCGPVA